MEAPRTSEGKVVSVTSMTGALMPSAYLDAEHNTRTVYPDREVTSLCPYCGVGCQVSYKVKDEKIVYAEGVNGPANHNRLCVKGRFGFDYVHHPHRLTKPLIRLDNVAKDANDQVAASIDHAQRITAKADDFDKLMRAQSQQLEADAKLRAREILDRAGTKAQKIIDTVTAHSQSVLRDAEDRTRQLRWQQQQLTSFMSEVKELIRPDAAAPASADDAAEAPAAD